MTDMQLLDLGSRISVERWPAELRFGGPEVAGNASLPWALSWIENHFPNSTIQIGKLIDFGSRG